jgi:rare lipoprotein A (peptidoglycan hydrolase)
MTDRGPFPSPGNPRSGERLNDLSLGAACRLGFERRGTARVRVEVIALREEPG